MKTSEKIYKAKKSLGQNFLKSEPALRNIVEAGEIKKEDVILEIGPGKGALTEKLLEASNKVIAVEKDYELFSMLKEKFSLHIESGTFVLVREDVLEFDASKIAQHFGQLHYKIIANIPYNITGAILKKFLTDEHQPERMVLMVQHEVAKRILDKKGSLLSISILAYGEPKMIMKVPKRYFSPSPKVDSAVILIKNISRKVFIENKIGEEKFWEIVKLGFAHKRKKLSGNLKGVINFQNSELVQFGNKRAEELTLQNWISFVKSV